MDRLRFFIFGFFFNAITLCHKQCEGPCARAPIAAACDDL